MTAKIIQFAERSPKKINQKYFDAFFEQLKAGISCGTRAEVGKVGPVSEESSAQAPRSESQQNCAGLGAEWGIPPAGMGYVGEDGGFVPEFADSVVQDAPSPIGDGAHCDHGSGECAPKFAEVAADALPAPQEGPQRDRKQAAAVIPKLPANRVDEAERSHFIQAHRLEREYLERYPGEE